MRDLSTARGCTNNQDPAVGELAGITVGERGERCDRRREAGGDGRGGTFAEAASAAELVFNCTSGEASLEALAAAGVGNLAGKVLVDVANPLDFSQGIPPTLTVCNDDSLGERIQAAFPEAKVVKALNTMNNRVMTEPGRLPGAHNVFVCGEDAAANHKEHDMKAINGDLLVRLSVSVLSSTIFFYKYALRNIDAGAYSGVGKF